MAIRRLITRLSAATVAGSVVFCAASGARADDASATTRVTSGTPTTAAAGSMPATTTSTDVDRLNLPPAPLDSPPFPGSDWTGPDPLIGTKDSTPESFTEQLIKNTSLGRFMQQNRIRAYGWIDVGGNLSTSKQSNTPDSYDLLPNQVVLDQAVFRVERVLDTAQTDHYDWGFRVSQLYGTDYRYTVAKGYGSEQLLSHNRLYGYDFPEFYGEVYLPGIAQGMVVKVGRYISPADIEAQLSPQNYMYTHSITFSYDPYTFTGVNTVTKLSKNWAVELGFHFGNDMAPWVNSAQPNGLAMIDWKSDDGNDAIYGGLNAIGSGKFRDDHDNLQQLVGVWGHKFNDKLHMQTEAYYMWQYDALRGGTVINGPSYPYAGSGPGAPIHGIADEWGFINYMEYKLTDKDYLTLRTDVFDDMKGQRTGYATMLNSETFGLSHNFTSFLTFRPEIRWDHSWQQPAFNNGLRKNQLTMAADLIVNF